MLYKNQIFYMADAVDYLTTDIDLKKVANAIRGRTGKTATISYPDGYVSEINKLYDTSDATATASNVLKDKITYGPNGKITGTMPDASFANSATSGTTYTDISSTAPVLISKDYLYINKGYTDNVKISLAKLTPDGASGANAIKAGMLQSVSAYDNDGNLVAGNIATKTASNLTASGATISIPAGYYASTVSKSVATATQATPTVNIDTSTGLITASATQTAGYVTAGTKSGTKQLTTQASKVITPSTKSQTAVAANVYTTGIVSVAAMPTGAMTASVASHTVSNPLIKTEPSGSITNIALASEPNGTDGTDYWTISATGTVGAKGSSSATGRGVISTAGYLALNDIATSTADTKEIGAAISNTKDYYIKKGSAKPATSLSGTSATITTGTNTLTLTKTISMTPVVSAGYVSSGTAGNVSTSLTASVTTKAAQTYYPSTSAQTIAAKQYLTGAQTIAATTTSNLSAANIIKGVNIKVGDSANTGRIANITGTADYVKNVTTIPTAEDTNVIYNTNTKKFYVWKD